MPRPPRNPNWKAGGGDGARKRRNARTTREFLEKKRLDPTWTRSGETQV